MKPSCEGFSKFTSNSNATSVVSLHAPGLALDDVVVASAPAVTDLQKWIVVVLTPTNRHIILHAAGYAYGFQTLEDGREICYRMSAFCHGAWAQDVRWDDPAFQIGWPGAVAVISERDRTYPNWEHVPCVC
jgi:dTDP-4-dehydrorhamnose 3,5-epimerase